MIQKLLYDYFPMMSGADAAGEDVKALFYRGPGQNKHSSLRIKKGGMVTFDTYFNMFSALKWKEYTAIEELTIKLELKGRGEILLYGAKLAGPDKEIPIGKVPYDSADRAEKLVYHVKMGDLPDFLYFKIRAEKDTELCGGGYDAVLASPNRVKIAVGICTYRREKELEENIKKIKEQIFEDVSSPLHDSLDVYIADNGHTLKDIPFFTDAVKEHGDRLFLFENKNCGGSAGFTRCMIEAVLKKDVGYTHMLLMDDDANVEPFVLERTEALLKALKKGYRDKFVGGACLSLEKRIIQGPNGSCVLKVNNDLRPKEHKIGYDLTVRKEAVLNEKKEFTNYNRWVYCCIPSKYITKDNLPLPFFLHWDDSEYALRCGGIKGNFVITLNGICVWHPDDQLKQPEYISYYNNRNHFITAAEFSMKLSWGNLKDNLLITVLSSSLSFNYYFLMYIMLGALAFYEGIDAFKSLDAEKLNTKLRNGPKSWRLFKAGEEEMKRLSPPSNYGHVARVVRKLITWALPAVRGTAYYNKNCHPLGVDYFLRKEIIYVDTNTGDAIAIRKDYRQLFRVIREYFKLRKLMKAHHDAVWKEWHERIGELQTLDFWEKYLELK